MIVYDVPRSENDEATLDAIFEQNTEAHNRATLRKQVKLAFKTGDRNKEKCNWVLEVSKEAREFFSKKERLYVGWSSCKVQDHLVATRCYKCQGYGHTAKHCRSEKETCGHCAETGHNFKNCPNKGKAAVCSNCKKMGKQSLHSVTGRDCPAYASAIDQILLRTDYGQ
ncbi:Uncharacterized 50 kDa protein in type I retrotransposable element R1DM [Anthophora retusa]